MSKNQRLVLWGMASVTFVMVLALIFIVFINEPAKVEAPALKVEEVVATMRSQFTSTPTATMEPSQTPTPLPTSTPTATPTMTPRVIDYRLDGVIDLSSGLPVVMTIYKSDGSVIASNWARAIAYKDGDGAEVFDPHNGTIYSHNDGGFVATWVHSGYLIGGSELFGYAFEKAVWLDESGQPVSLEVGRQKARELIGSTMVLCQASADAPVNVFDSYDPSSGCSGSQLEFMVVGAAIVEREKTDAYEAEVGRVVPWLIANYPGDGFEALVTRDGYLLQTCVGKYSDQVSDGTVNYLYNRLVIGFSLK